jgi:hypothetical protein
MEDYLVDDKTFQVVKGYCDEGCDKAIWEGDICLFREECNLPLGLIFKEVK